MIVYRAVVLYGVAGAVVVEVGVLRLQRAGGEQQEHYRREDFGVFHCGFLSVSRWFYGCKIRDKKWKLQVFFTKKMQGYRGFGDGYAYVMPRMCLRCA